MKKHWSRTSILLLVVLTSCSRDPQVVKRKYLESGNRYYERGKYREASIMYRSALRKDPRYAEAYYRLGLTALKLSQPGAALRHLTRAFELLPPGRERDETSSRLADLYLAQFLLDSRRSSPVRDELESFLRDPKVTSFDRLRLEAHLAWRDGNLEGAVEKFQQALSQRPGDRGVALALIQVFIARGEELLRQRQPEKADGYVREAVRLATELIAKEKDFAPPYEVLYGFYLRRGNLAEAERIRKLKAENNPGNLDYRFQLASHYLRIRRPDLAEQVVRAVAADRKNFPRGQERAGDFFMVHGLYDKAIEYYRQALANNQEAWLALQRKIADALIGQGRRDEALLLLEREILKRYPSDIAAQALRATLWVDSRDRTLLQRAISDLEEALRKMPKNPVLRHNLGRAYWARGDLEPARIQFQAALDLQSDYLPARQALCQLHLARNEFAAALQHADVLVAMAPDSAVARLLRAQALQGTGKFEDSRRELTEAARHKPDSPAPLFGLAWLEMRTGKFDSAHRAFDECLARFDSYLPCKLGRAEAFIAQKRFDRAEKYLTEELSKDPERRELRLALGNTLLLGGNHQRAAEVFRALLAKEPDSADLHMRLGEAYRRMGDYKRAIEEFQRVKALQPTNADAQVWLALFLHMVGREDEARQLYQDILRLQPDNAIALNNLAYVMAEKGGDLDLALTYAQRARQRMPDVPEIADTVGFIYLQKKLTSNALAIYDELVSKYPANPIFRYHRAVALLQKGDKPGARRELETALRHSPTPDYRQKIQKLLQEIG